MIVQFVDTHYLLALVNSSDKDHVAAVGDALADC